MFEKQKWFNLIVGFHCRNLSCVGHGNQGEKVGFVTSLRGGGVGYRNQGRREGWLWKTVKEDWLWKMRRLISLVYSGNCPRGGLHFVLSRGGRAQLMLGPENPLKSIDFTGPEAGLAPIALPLNAPLVDLIKKIIIMFLF